jgi:23S rRNA (guanosine2251-2'-O)-methyltransferase
MTNQEIVFGRQPVSEMLRAGRREVRSLLMANNIRDSAASVVQLLKLAEKKGVTVRRVLGFELDRLCHSGHHQGVAAEVSEYPYMEIADLLVVPEGRRMPPLLLLVDHVQDPQNLGSILRSSDAAGVDGVVIPVHRAAEVTSAVVRASAGAAEHVRVAQVTSLHQAMLRMKEEGIWMVGLEGTSDAVPYTAAKLDGPVALVVGGEDEGLSKLVRETCDEIIRLPMRGRVGSLNAAVAAAIAMYEVRRRQEDALRPAGE